jgi:hypothetical protein
VKKYFVILFLIVLFINLFPPIYDGIHSAMLYGLTGYPTRKTGHGNLNKVEGSIPAGK